VTHISAYESVLLFGRGVEGSVAVPRCFLVVIVVAPFGKVVGELETRRVCAGVFKVNDDELLVCVCGQEERRFTRGENTEDVAVLSLQSVK
jgi:hypothetical protein